MLVLHVKAHKLWFSTLDISKYKIFKLIIGAMVSSMLREHGLHLKQALQHLLFTFSWSALKKAPCQDAFPGASFHEQRLLQTVIETEGICFLLQAKQFFGRLK
jgi:hypothetical protein